MENNIMLLCDIGHTSYHFFDGKNDYKKGVNTFIPEIIQEKVYYICVNVKILKRLKKLKNWINIEPYIDKTQFYQTMGIDRIIASLSINNGVIIDAGSAITVDIIKDNIFNGGFIYPGMIAMNKCFKSISSNLNYNFNFSIDLYNLPKNSQNSISYGYLKGLYLEVISYNLPIILTGGDALKFKTIFKNATVDEMLIFKGMKILIETNK